MEATGGSLRDVFAKYCKGKPEIDSKEYAKIYKDAGLIGKKLTTNDCDINFSKVKNKGSKGITFEQFEKTLELAAPKLGMTKDAIASKIATACSQGPKLHGTKAGFVKFHDDKSTYTGVYARGGPTTVDAGNGIISDISQTCNRSAADVRGVVKKK